MRIILISNREDRVRTMNMNGWAKALLSVLLLGIPTAAGTFLGYKLSDVRVEESLDTQIGDLNNQLESQRDELDSVRKQAQNHLAAMASRLAEMRARLVRLDALGERLSGMASLDDGDFDFSVAPGLGGPESNDPGTVAEPVSEELDRLFGEMDSKLDNRESQLRLLQTMLSENRVREERTVSGRPVKKGWMSSGYGTRTDPFHGDKRWHAGIDFAGKEGADVVAVASGVVTASEERGGYGQLIEIDHGDGYVTRYGHNEELMVKVGDVVKKGQTIAHMGSTGRSTGPHVHFEVYKNGRTVDPASYIRRTRR